ncbi:MAG: DUF192 domain-containing protein [bacterium]|nr:DUF192 domain-containing protein [bacterium]
MKQKFVPFFLLAFALAFVYLRFTTFRPNLTEMRVGSATIEVDIADTIGKQRQGLSGRPSLPKDQGMYFPMDQVALHGFWMKDMHFPLDIIWIRGGVIVDISENVPYPLEGQTPVSVQPKEPADAILEVNADFIKQHGIKIGDLISAE